MMHVFYLMTATLPATIRLSEARPGVFLNEQLVEGENVDSNYIT